MLADSSTGSTFP